MSDKDDIKKNWVRLLELRETFFPDLSIFKWNPKLKWRKEFNGMDEALPYWILAAGFNGLKYLFSYLIDMYCFAAAAETVAKEYEDGGDTGMMGFWRYSVRNYHFYDFIPRYFSFLDHAAYFVASLSEWKLVHGTNLEKKGTMYYGTFRPILSKSLHSPEKIGCLTQQDRKILFAFLRAMDIEPKDPELNKIARGYRQDTTHLFFPGIDHIMQIMVPQFERKDGRKTYNVVSWGLCAGPEYRFDELERFAKAVIPMIDESFELLLTTDVMTSCLETPVESGGDIL